MDTQDVGPQNLMVLVGRVALEVEPHVDFFELAVSLDQLTPGLDQLIDGCSTEIFKSICAAFQAQRLQVVEVYRQRDAGAGPATVAGAGDGLVLAGEETQEGLMATEGGAGIGQRRDSARRSRVQRMACSRRGSIRPNRVSDGCR